MNDQGLAVGMQLPTQAQSRLFVPAWEEDAGAAELVQVAQACDRIVEALRAQAAIGVDQVQVAFKSRSVDELCDQIEAVGTDVLPYLAGAEKAEA